MMASVNPTIRKRIARSILEVGGCVVFWSLTDGMENAEVSTRVDLQGQSLTSKIQNCSFQGKSMFAEYRMLYNKISMKCEGEVKTVTKSKSITQADMNEFFDNVAPINIRTVLPPAWFASSLNASAAEFKKQYATVTPEEEAGMTSFVRHGHKPPLVDLLDLIVLKAKNEEALNKHFSYYMGTLLLRVKSMYGSRMSSQEAFDCEVYKTGYTLFLSALWLKITQSAFRNHFLEFDKPVIRNVLKSNYAVSVLLTCCYIFCLGKIRMGITDVLSTGPVTSQIGQIVHSIKQEDLAASDEGDQTDSASVDKVKLMKWVLFSFFKSSPVPSGGTPEEPINMRNVGIYAIIRPINELVVFSIMLPLSLGLYVWRPAAAVLPAFAVSTKKCFRIDDDVFCHSRDLPMLETFINNVLTFTFATSLYASTSNLVYPLIFIITTHMEEVIKWFRSCDHLLRPNWSFILDVRYLLETLTYYKYLAFKRGGSPPTEEMRSFAEAMAEIYSTDYWNEKKSKKMSVKDLEAVTVGLEYYFEKHHGVTKDKAGPFTLVYIVLDWLFHDPSNKKVGSSLPLDVLKLLDEDYTAHQAHQIELNQVYFDAKTDFFNRLAGPTGLDMDGFTDYLDFLLRDYSKKTGPVTLQDVVKKLPQWQESNLDEFLDLIQAKYDIILGCDRVAYPRYDQALYDQLEIKLAGRYDATELERRMHMTEIKEAVSAVRMWHVGSYLTSQGLSVARYDELFKCYAARHKEVEELNSLWAAYFSCEKYRIKNLELLSQKGHSRYFMKLIDGKLQFKISLNQPAEDNRKSNS